MHHAALRGWQAIVELVATANTDMSWTSLAAHVAIAPLANRLRWQLALKLTNTNDYTIINQIASTCVRTAHWQEALQLLEFKGSSSGPSATVAVGIQFDALQKGYAWQMALLMLQARHNRPLNSVVWNAALGACGAAQRWEVVLSLINEMVAADLSGDVITSTVAVAACAQSLRWQQTLELFGKCGVATDAVTLASAVYRSQEATMRRADVTTAIATLRETLERMSLHDEHYHRAFSLGVATSQLLWQEDALPRQDLQHLSRHLYATLRDNVFRAARFQQHHYVVDAVLSQPTLGRGPAPDFLCCSETLRGLHQVSAAGDWHDRDLWRHALGLLSYMEEESIQADVLTLNWALEICKDCRAVAPVFEIFEHSINMPNLDTFEHVVSSCVLAPGQHWWRAVRAMRQAEKLLPKRQLRLANAKSVKACVDASAWNVALFHFRAQLEKLDFNPELPGRAAWAHPAGSRWPAQDSRSWFLLGR
eukprot:symbB.v1.2.002340.t1/scaffold121.1/size317807/4